MLFSIVLIVISSDFIYKPAKQSDNPKFSDNPFSRFLQQPSDIYR